MTESIDLYKTFNQPDEEPVISLDPGMVLNTKYELIEQIGRGGMGVVWKAKDRVGDRLVALKFVPPDLQRFESEMQRVRETFGKVHALNHQAICPLYGLEDGGIQIGHYLVMKYLEGETLGEYMMRIDRKRRGFRLEQVVTLLTRVAKALDYAHRYDVIHRDIKPSNIFLVNTGKGVEVQVIDFGLADEIKASLTRVSQRTVNISGTRPYMAPEQWRGHRQTAATDQYALAVVAYELLSGHLPFEVKDTELLRLAVMQDTPERIQKIPDAANVAILKAMAKDKEERFESCTGFIKALIELNVVKPKEPEQPKEDFLQLPEMNENPSHSLHGGAMSAGPSVASLLKRGQLFLEDSDWRQANEYFDKVLDIDPEYAPAYTGKLCAELKLRYEEQLGDYEMPISAYNNFKKAIRFADDEYKTQVDGYDQKIRDRILQEQKRREEEQRNREEQARLERERREELKRIERERQEEERRLRLEQERLEQERREEQEQREQYEWLREEAKRCSTEEDYRRLAGEFRAINGYQNSAKFADECDNMAVKVCYQRLCEKAKKAATEVDFRRLAREFRAMDGYNDTGKLADECDRRCNILQERREVQEHLEQEWIEQERLQRVEEEQLEQKLIEHAQCQARLDSITGCIFIIMCCLFFGLIYNNISLSDYGEQWLGLLVFSLILCGILCGCMGLLAYRKKLSKQKNEYECQSSTLEKRREELERTWHGHERDDKQERIERIEQSRRTASENWIAFCTTLGCLACYIILPFLHSAIIPEKLIREMFGIFIILWLFGSPILGVCGGYVFAKSILWLITRIDQSFTLQQNNFHQTNPSGDYNEEPPSSPAH